MVTNVNGINTAAPIFSAMVSHDHPVNSVKLIAHKNSNASVAPNELNHGMIALLKTLPITPPEEKFGKSSKFSAASPHEDKISAKPPINRNESEKKSI